MRSKSQRCTPASATRITRSCSSTGPSANARLCSNTFRSWSTRCRPIGASTIFAAGLDFGGRSPRGEATESSCRRRPHGVAVPVIGIGRAGGLGDQLPHLAGREDHLVHAEMPRKRWTALFAGVIAEYNAATIGRPVETGLPCGSDAEELRVSTVCTDRRELEVVNERYRSAVG